MQKKNNWDQSTDYYYAPKPREVVLDRKRPGDGYLHILNKHDLYTFLELLPDWDELAVGLNAIVLAPGNWGLDGYHTPGVVHICAWISGLWEELPESYYRAHSAIFERLSVPCDLLPNGNYLCKFDEDAVHGYQLLHILLHELGHHHDRMTTRAQKRSGRGESYAENYAIAYADAIWDAYLRAFRR